MLKNILAILIFLGGSFSISYSQTNPAISEEVKKTIQSRIDNGINTGIVVGIIGPEGTQYYSYGLKSKKSGESVDEHSIFEIGSISKTFTGIILADKVLKGEMKLDDPLQKYLPEGITAPTRNGEAIKLVNMSNHTSSLPRLPNNFAPANPANPYADYSEEQLYDFLNGYELTRDIGSQYEYSNYAVGLLGYVMAAQSKMTYEELMVKVIAKPLKMKNTRIVLTSKMKKNLAIAHSNGIEVENWDLPTLAGAGAIRSSTVDMIKYIAANMGSKKSKLLPAMQLSHKNTRKEGFAPIVGLGWHVQMNEDQEIVWHNGGTGGYRTFSGFIKGGNKGVVVMTNSDVSVDDIGLHLLNPESPLREIKPSISGKLRDAIDSKGIEEGVKIYWQLKEERATEFNFAEEELNNLGYYYLGKEEVDKAIAVLKLNVKAFPDAFNTYDSLGEAYKTKGDKEKAITNYKKSVELNPGNEGGILMLKELGVDTENLVKEVVVDEKIMESYVGKYELVPGFILTVTKDGKQMEAQATGQPKFPIFPKSDNVFYLKVVVAQLTFNTDEEGVVKSVTLLQDGQEIEGKKID
jgi:CubicO group peptidase (beta-lactamase class C family)